MPVPLRLLLLALGLATIASAPAAAQALSCDPIDGRYAAYFEGEVSLGQARSLDFGPGYQLRLLPADHGWDVAILDRDGLDLSQVTPPRHGPNPRQLYGWHFRNAGNTGANDGSVNAPQHLRLFLFAPSLTGTAGIKPSGPITPEEAEAAEGRGWLRVLDLGLADLEPGMQARMVWLKFDACLTWPTTYGTAVSPENTVTPELIEQFGACGLPPDLTIDPFLNTVELGGDFDGDGALDLAAPVVRQDGKRAIAICRAGTWLDVLGLEGEMGELVPAYFESIDWWTLQPVDQPVGVGAGGPDIPVLIGDGIVIGKEDSSSVLIYRTADGYASYWQGD